MRSAPTTEEIKKWLIKRNPLGLFRGGFSITDIDPKPWSGHFNFLITARGEKIILRFKGPEWGDIDGTAHEYTILKKIGKYTIAPQVYYCTKSFFGESMMFEEFMGGKLLSNLAEDVQRKHFPAVARYIAKINSVPFRKDGFPFSNPPYTSYTASIRTWKTRIRYITREKKTKVCGEKLTSLLPYCEQILRAFEDNLRDVLTRTGNVFIFESAHAGHCLKTKNGFRFLNWEKVSYGDPSYTLAVFLTSIRTRPDFESIKEKMIRVYLTEKYIPGFRDLIDQRIIERRISNIIWSIYTYARKEKELIPHANKKIEELKEIIRESKGSL